MCFYTSVFWGSTTFLIRNIKRLTRVVETKDPPPVRVFHRGSGHKKLIIFAFPNSMAC